MEGIPTGGRPPFSKRQPCPPAADGGNRDLPPDNAVAVRGNSRRARPVQCLAAMSALGRSQAARPARPRPGGLCPTMAIIIWVSTQRTPHLHNALYERS